MSAPCHGLLRDAPAGTRHAARCCGLGLAILAAGLACQDALQPLPRPFTPNIEVTSWPLPGSTLDPLAADSVVLAFSRPMEPRSLRFFTKMSFLFPLTVADFEGRWNADSTRVAFGLTRFPVQPGALYEAVFAGLRTAAGDLYNMGPYTVSFRTRGAPDLFPLVPPARLALRRFCRRPSAESRDCARSSILTVESAGVDSVALGWSCATGCDTPAPARLDLYRKNGDRLEWLGYDLLDPGGEPRGAVRWPQPPALLALPAEPELVLEGTPQTSADGTRLDRWRATTASGTDSPSQILALPALAALPGLQLQIVFSECRVVDLEYTLASPGGMPESRHERWWLYPGVGLVRREIRTEPAGAAALTYELQIYEPDVASFPR